MRSIKTGQVFQARSKVSDWITYTYGGRLPNGYHLLLNDESFYGTIEIEDEWFNQRQIKWLDQKQSEGGALT